MRSAAAAIDAAWAHRALRAMTVSRPLIFCLAITPLLALIVLGSSQLAALLADPIVLAALFRTLLLAEIVVPIALVLSVPAALGAAEASPVLRRLIAVIACAPLAMPPFWMAQGLRTFATQTGLPWANLLALVLLHAMPSASVAFLLMASITWRADRFLRETAYANGASYWRSWGLSLGTMLPRGIALSAAGAFATACGFGLADSTLAPAGHATLAMIVTADLQTHDIWTPGAGLLLALLCLPPIVLVLGLGALTRRR